MAVAFVAGAGSTYASRSSNVLTKPTGTADTNCLLMLYLTAAATTAPTAAFPGGWTVANGFPLSVSDQANFNMKIWLLWKIASGEGASYTVTHTAASCQGWVGCWSGNDTTTPLAPDPTTASGQSGIVGALTTTATGLTTTRDDSMIMYIGTDWGDAAANLSPPAGMTEAFDTPVSYVAWEARPTAGATGSRSHATNTTVNGSGWSASLAAIQPPAGATSGVPYVPRRMPLGV